MSDHPDLDRLYALAGETSDAASDPHVASCETCADTVSWLIALRRAVDEGPLPDPPERVLRRALAIPGEHSMPRRERERSWSLARLLRDTFATPAPAGVRGSAAARRLLYEAEGATVDLEIAVGEPGDRYRVTGLLLPSGSSSPDRVPIVLWKGDRPVARTRTDEAGVFEIDGLAAGRYRLEAWDPGRELAVRIAPIEIGEEAP